MYEIKNITGSPRKFRDSKTGQWITLRPNESCQVRSRLVLDSGFSISGGLQPEKLEESQIETNKNDEDENSSSEN